MPELCPPRCLGVGITCFFWVGDRVYFYKTDPQKRILYCAEVVAANLAAGNEREEQDFYKVQPMTDDVERKYARLKLLAQVKNPDALTLERLEEHGMNFAPRRGLNLRGELLDYISREF